MVLLLFRELMFREELCRKWTGGMRCRAEGRSRLEFVEVSGGMERSLTLGTGFEKSSFC